MEAIKTAEEFFEKSGIEPTGEFWGNDYFSYWTEYDVIRMMKEYGEYMFEQGHKEGFEDGILRTTKLL